MTREEMQRIAATKATARCGVCGHNWKIERGDAFRCPYCYNSPEDLTICGSLVLLEDDGYPRYG